MLNARTCNAGHPDTLLHTGADPAKATLHQLASTDPIIGMLPPGMPFQTRDVELGPYARLLVYSDGVFEIEPASGGEMWRFPEFVEYVSGLLPTGASLIEPLVEKARQLRQGELLADDYSLIEARL